MHFALFLIGKLIRRWTPFGPAAFPTHATATAMHFPANAGLIFLTDELTNDKYLVDTGATLSIVPCSQNSSPSGPLLKGADGQPIPSWGFIQKTVQFQGKLSRLLPHWPIWGPHSRGGFGIQSRVVHLNPCLPGNTTIYP